MKNWVTVSPMVVIAKVVMVMLVIVSVEINDWTGYEKNLMVGVESKDQFILAMLFNRVCMNWLSLT